MRFEFVFIWSILFLLSCNINTGTASNMKQVTPADLYHSDENPYAAIKNIPLPPGFTRQVSGSNSFASYLANIELKRCKTVFLYNGQPKLNQSAQFAVLDISIPKKDLQQCADAIMRIRAEYLYAQKEFDKIIFFDNDHTAYKFSFPYTRDNFTTYIEKVFGMCGSASLAKQMNPVPFACDIQPGDVLIRGGFPGHAVLVIDIAVNERGKKVCLLAQSYMPAQDIHILKNPMNERLSPWYEVNDDQIIYTPEYIFSWNDLKKW